MLKSYAELRKVDVSKYVDKRDNLDYLNWAKCIELLHENGAEKVFFVPLVNENGSSLFMSEQTFSDSKNNTNRCYETRIEIHIDDDVYIMQSPVMNGGNPVKDNSMTQARVWASMCRSFVKGVAIYTGLGFDLWCKSEGKEEKNYSSDDLSAHDITKIRDRVFEKITYLNKKDMTLDDIGAKIGRSADELKGYLSQFKILEAFEKNLDAIIAEK